MDIETDDFQGKNRRKNGLRLTAGDYIKIICITAIVVTTGIIGWTNLKAQVKDNNEEIVELEEQHEKDIEGINGKLETLVTLLNGQAIAQGKLQATLEYIQKDISIIKANSK